MAIFAQAWRTLDTCGQQAGRVIGGAAIQAGGWIKKHPSQTVGIVGSAVAAPIAIAATPLVLGVAGFTSAGVAAGSAAAVAQASIGNVAAGSAFAIIQSAGAGGAGLAFVNSIVGASTTAIALGATALGIASTTKKENEQNVDEMEGGETDQEDTGQEK